MYSRLRSQHDPDEHWQSSEVAHRLVFGYGFLTWEWTYAVRSYVHVLPFAALFRLLRAAVVDAPLVVAFAPRLLQAVAMAASDVCLGRLTERHIAPGAGLDAVLCSSTSWYVWFCGVRTYSSCTEAALLGAALALVPPPTHAVARCGKAASEDKWLVTAAALLGALALAVRPTAILLLLPLLAAHLACSSRASAASTAARVAIACASVLSLGLLADRLCYGRWVVPAATFLCFNWLGNGSAYYGAHPWHWYASTALPAALGTHAPLVALGIWRARAASGRGAGVPRLWACAPALAAALALSALSTTAHKELRFAYALVHPCLMGYGGAALHGMSSRARRRWLLVLVLSNALPTVYLSAWHQSGPVALMAAARRELGLGRLTHLDLLTSCHQTPAYSQLHAPVRVTMLHCPPPGLAHLPPPTKDVVDGPEDTGLVEGHGRRSSKVIEKTGHVAVASRTAPGGRGRPGGGFVGVGSAHWPRGASSAHELPWLESASQLRKRYPSAVPGCVNECECFFSAPGPAVTARYRRPRWWRRWGGSRGEHAWPSHVALFDELLAVPEVGATLSRQGFVVLQAFFHELVWDGQPGARGVRVRRLLLLHRAANSQ